MTNLKYYEAYTAIGLKPIAVYRGTKIPIGKNWNKNWQYDYWKDYFLNDDYNMGLLLGDVIDVEADTEEANDLLIRMIDNYPHPTFKSQRSIHHLFKSPDINLTKEVFQGIEFRGHDHQSVIPPSIHSSGDKYQWLKNSIFDISCMPDELLNFYLKNKSESKNTVRQKKRKRLHLNNIKTVCNKCKNSFYINKSRLALEVKAFSIYQSRWVCRECRNIDIRKDCRNLKRL